MSITPPHYSPLLRAGDTWYISGQLPIIDRVSLEMPVGSYQQALFSLSKVEQLLVERGMNRYAIVKTTCFITDEDGWGEVNRAYHDFFGDHKPARSIVPVPSLHFGCLVEIEAIAYQSS